MLTAVEAWMLKARVVLQAALLGLLMLLVLLIAIDAARLTGRLPESGFAWSRPAVIGAVVVMAAVALMHFACCPIHLALRRRSMRNVADRFGLSFEAEGPSMIAHRLSGFRLFADGRDKRVQNRARGRLGEIEIEIFDYRFRPYEKSDTDRESCHTVVCLQAEGPAQDRVLESHEGIVREAFGHRLISYTERALLPVRDLQPFIEQSLRIFETMRSGRSGEETEGPEF